MSLSQITKAVEFSPVYDASDHCVYCQDCLHILKALPAECVDAVFADPPYFGNQSNLTIRRTDGHSDSFKTDKAQWAFSRSLRFQFDFHKEWLTEAKRILKKEGTIWISGSYHSIGVINVVLQQLRFKILNDIVLFKNNAPPNFKGTCFRAMTETMLWAKRGMEGRKKFNYWEMKELNGGKQMSNLWEYTAQKNPFRHPATKQPIILELVIRASTNRGDLILDPFAGSGTTGYVASALGRKSILIELEKKYCEIITKRMEGGFGRYQPKYGTK